MTIAGFFKEYRFLSNFYPARVVYDGEEYSTSEHAFVASKTLDLDEREAVREIEKPGDAKQFGKRVRLRKDWNRNRVSIMRGIIFNKFINNKELKEKLLATGDRFLVEENPWQDIFWGECDGKGKNHLGKILMEVRSKIKSLREK